MRRENLYLYTEFFVYIFHIEFFVLHHDLSLPDWKNSKTKAVLKKKNYIQLFLLKKYINRPHITLYYVIAFKILNPKLKTILQGMKSL